MAKRMLSPDEIKLKPFTTHGLDFTDMSGNDHQADCPFCGGARKFHVDPDTTKWVCSTGLDKCGRTGNLVTFIRQWHAACFELTTDAQWQGLSRLRDGLPARIFKHWRVAFNPLTQEWLIPNHNPDGLVHDVRRWKPKRSPMSTPTASAGLWNAHELHEPLFKRSWPVWVCEGEWDGMALWHWVKLCGLKVIVVAVPGANVFKEDWVPWFKDREVIFWYDNDATGLEYSWRKAKLLYGVASRVRWHFWPGDYPEKFDVRDQYCSVLVRKSLKPRPELMKLIARLTDKHPSALEDATAPAAAQPPRVRPATNPSLLETMDVYNKNFKMSPDLRMATRLTFATVLSQQIHSDPLWLFMVGAPGSGKTALLMALKKVHEVSFHSNITAKALLSGFKNPKGEDPSVIGKLIKAGVGVFKDFTQLLGHQNQLELEAVNRCLRGAYDGTTEQSFGNGEYRKLEGLFTLLAGVTDEIHGYSESAVGERFVKYELAGMSSRKHQELLYEVFCSTSKQKAGEERMQDAAARFLDRNIPDCDPQDMVAPPYIRRMTALAELVASLRQQVSWARDFGYDKVLRYRPKPELGTRLTRVFCKLAMSLCHVDGVREFGREQYRVVERVAFDTGIGFNLDIIEGMMAMADGRNVNRTDLAEAVRIPRSTLNRRLEDLLLLDVVQASAKQPVRNEITVGRPPEVFDVHPHLRELWHKASPDESHVDSAAVARQWKKGGTDAGSK